MYSSIAFREIRFNNLTCFKYSFFGNEITLLRAPLNIIIEVANVFTSFFYVWSFLGPTISSQFNKQDTKQFVVGFLDPVLSFKLTSFIY